MSLTTEDLKTELMKEINALKEKNAKLESKITAVAKTLSDFGEALIADCCGNDSLDELTTAIMKTCELYLKS